MNLNKKKKPPPYKGGGKPAVSGLGEVSPFTENKNQKSNPLCVSAFPHSQAPRLAGEAGSLGMSSLGLLSCSPRGAGGLASRKNFYLESLCLSGKSLYESRDSKNKIVKPKSKIQNPKLSISFKISNINNFS